MVYNKYMKKPFLYALASALYIVAVVFGISTITSMLADNTILIPITLLGLFVLSAAIIGFLFLIEPFRLYMEEKKKEAVIFFVKTVGFFACFVVAFLVSLLLW
jgi:hypothetical protein